MHADNETILTYGPTLARPMPYEHAAALIGDIIETHAEGGVEVVVTRSHVPGIANVECAIFDLSPDRAIQALAIAARQIAKMHGKGREPAAVIDLNDELALRATADHLVDLCRASGFSADSELITRSFDQTREMCVIQVMAALAVAHSTKG